MRLLLPVAAAFLWPVCGAAQGRSGTPAPPVTHASCVENTHRLLGAFTGDYRVEAAMRLGTGAWDSIVAVAHFRQELDGCLMEERFEGTRDGEPYITLSLWGTSGAPDHPIQRTMAHSQHGLLGLSEGSWNAAGDTLTLGDSALVRGTWIQQRYVLTRPRNGTFTAVARRSEDHGKTWTVTLRSRYERAQAGGVPDPAIEHETECHAAGTPCSNRYAVPD